MSESEADNRSFVSLRVAVEHKALKVPISFKITVNSLRDRKFVI